MKSEQPASGYRLEMALIRYKIENLGSTLLAAAFIMPQPLHRVISMVFVTQKLFIFLEKAII